MKGGSEGTLSGPRNRPFRARGGSDGGGGVPSSRASSTVHLAPGEGQRWGGFRKYGIRIHVDHDQEGPRAFLAFAAAAARLHFYWSSRRDNRPNKAILAVKVPSLSPVKTAHFASGEGGRVWHRTLPWRRQSLPFQGRSTLPLWTRGRPSQGRGDPPPAPPSRRGRKTKPLCICTVTLVPHIRDRSVLEAPDS